MAIWNEAQGVILDLSDVTPEQLGMVLKTFPAEKVKEINDKIDAYTKANKTMDIAIQLALFIAKAVISKGGSLI